MANPFAAVAAWSARFPALAIAITLVAALALGAGMSQAQEGRINELFVPDDLPALQVQRDIEAIWGESEMAFLYYETDTPTDPTLLRAVAVDMAAAAQLDGVQSVDGLPKLLAARIGNLETASNEQLADALASLPPQALQPFVTDDALLVRVTLDPVEDIPAMTDALDAVVAASTANADATAAGRLYVEEYQNGEAGKDVQILMPLSLLAVFVLLGVLFRRAQDVLVPVVTVLLSIIMAYGTVAWAGFALAPPSFITMPLLLGLGVDYMLHIVYAYRDEPVEGTVSSRFRNAAGHVGAPVFYTALTTLIGFGSFLVSNIPQIRTWGLLIGSGALYAFILGFVLMPALYRLRRKKHRSIRLPLGNVMDYLTRFVMNRRGPVLAAVLILTVGLGISALFVDVEAALEFDLDASSKSVNDLDRIQERFGGQSIVMVYVPDYTREGLVALETDLAAATGTSFVDGPIHRLQRAGGGELVSAATAGVATPEAARILVGYDYDERDIAINAVDAVAAAHGAQITGADVLDQESRESFLPTLLKSSLLALGLVVALLVIVFRRAELAALAFLPLAVTVIWQLGIQALVGIPINPITGVMTAMMLGVGVDYSLHIMAHYRDSKNAGATSEDAAAAAMRSVGRPVLAASITTVFAFAVLSFSSLQPLRQFGQVAAIVVTCAFVVSLTLLPVLASLLPDKRPTRKAATATVQARPVVRRVEFQSVTPRFVDPDVAKWHEATVAHRRAR